MQRRDKAAHVFQRARGIAGAGGGEMVQDIGDEDIGHKGLRFHHTAYDGDGVAANAVTRMEHRGERAAHAEDGLLVGREVLDEPEHVARLRGAI